MNCIGVGYRDTLGDDAKSAGSADRVPVVSATRNRGVNAAFPRPRQCLTGQQWVKPAHDGFGSALNSYDSLRV